MISRDLDGFARAVCGALQASRGGVTRKVDYYDKLEVEENFPIGIQNSEFLVLTVYWLSLLTETHDRENRESYCCQSKKILTEQLSKTFKIQ